MNRDRARKYLLESLNAIPGIPSKIGQFLASHDTPIDSRSLSSGLPVSAVREMIQNLHPELYSDLLELDPKPITASIGQVHQAVLRTGERVVIKIQLPGVKEEIENQLEFLFQSARWSPAAQFGLDREAYRTYFLEKLNQETNYILEAQHQIHFRKIWASFPHIVIPIVYEKYLHPKILVQSDEPSLSLSEVKGLSEDQKQACAIQITSYMLRSLFLQGCIHGDLQQQNWGYRVLEDQWILYDFGSTLYLNQNQITALRSLLILEKNPLKTLELWVQLGFDREKLGPILPELQELTSILMAPFSQTELWRPKEGKVGEQIGSLLGQNKWWFRTAGPPWFLALMRTVYLAVQCLEQLDVAIPLKAQYEELLGPIDLSLKLFSSFDSQVSRSFLHVVVLENEEEKIQICMPVHAVDRLEQLIPDDSRIKIEALGYDLNSIKLKVQASGYCAQVLFEARMDQKLYKIWIS